MSEELITVGKIANTQGHLGDVRCVVYSDTPQRFVQMKEIYVTHQGNTQIFHIQQARLHKNFVVYKFAEVADMNEAEALKEALIKVPKSQLAPLPEGHYYLFELIGLTVITVSGEELGEVVDVLQTGSNDVYVVKTAEQTEVLLPAIKQVVKQIDLAKQQIIVELMEGLL